MNKAQRPGKNVLAAWQEQLAGATREPLLARVLMERGGVLLPRFAHFYGALWALPRRRRRALQRRLGLSLAAVALLLALGSEPVPAATIRVDGTTCTLVDAITAANVDTESEGCPAGSGADTLVLSPGSAVVLLPSRETGPVELPTPPSEDPVGLLRHDVSELAKRNA